LITVIAGVNGAGKSSIAGARIRESGGEYFNPDEIARQLRDENPTLSQQEANARAWKMGYDHLVNAIIQDTDYNFETTLGGNSITQLLRDAMKNSVQIRFYYCGLSSVELHIERVRYRVSRGGHNIPEEKIRQRYTRSIHNMMTLLPGCYQAVVFDNSIPLTNDKPAIKKLFSVEAGKIKILEQDMPTWAKPLATMGLKNFQLA